MKLIKRNLRVIKRNKEFWKGVKGFPGYEISKRGLGKIFKVDPSNITAIVNYKTWKHL